MHRVYTPEEANYCVVFTHNKVRNPIILEKFYYYLPLSIHSANMVMEILSENPELADSGIRMDVYNVRNGRVCLYD